MLHPGSWSCCGGNPAGISDCDGGGCCGSQCSNCGAGTHWSCCGSTDETSKHCLPGITKAQAVRNADAAFKRQSFPISINKIPNVDYTVAGAPTTTTAAPQTTPFGSLVEEWCLGKSNIGTVVCAPAPLRSGGEQRNVIVMYEDPSTLQIRYSLYRSSWLTRAHPPPVFAVGDRVRLKPGTFLDYCPMVLNKCLGTPDQHRYGIVVSVGPVRNGVQRNVEVICPSIDIPQSMYSDINWEDVCEGHVDSPRSLYPAHVLAPAERCITPLPGDMARLKGLLQERWSGVDGPNVDTNVLVDKFGVEVSCSQCNYLMDRHMPGNMLYYHSCMSGMVYPSFCYWSGTSARFVSGVDARTCSWLA